MEIILLSGGIILSIIGWVMLTNLYRNACRSVCMLPGELIWVILPGLGGYQHGNVNTFFFKKNLNTRGWLEDALFFFFILRSHLVLILLRFLRVMIGM